MHTNGRYLNCECVCCPSVGKQIISVILDEMLMFSTTWTAYWNNLFHKHEQPPSPGQNRSSSSSITMRHILIHCVLKSFFSFVLLSFRQCILTHTHTQNIWGQFSMNWVELNKGTSMFFYSSVFYMLEQAGYLLLLFFLKTWVTVVSFFSLFATNVCQLPRTIWDIATKYYG